MQDVMWNRALTVSCNLHHYHSVIFGDFECYSRSNIEMKKCTQYKFHKHNLCL